MQLPVVFPWKINLYSFKTRSGPSKCHFGPFCSWLVRKRLDVNAGKGEASSEGSLGSPGCTDPEQLWLQGAEETQCRAGCMLCYPKFSLNPPPRARKGENCPP